MAAPTNPFEGLKKRHNACATEYLARIAFTGSTLRMFASGGGEKLRAFTIDRIGCGGSFIGSTRGSFERHHTAAVEKFPPDVRLNSNSKRSNRRPSYGQKAKIVDLYLKALSFERKPLGNADARRLRSYLHVPLDSIVLRWVWEHFKQDLKKTGVNKRPSLSSLNKRQYMIIQGLLRRKARQASAEPILYDDLWLLDKVERKRLAN